MSELSPSHNFKARAASPNAEGANFKPSNPIVKTAGSQGPRLEKFAKRMAAVIPLPLTSASTKCFKSVGRPKNLDVRSREHLTPDEVERMIAVAGQRGRYRTRDALLIMMAYRHGLRASELVGKQALRWDQVTFGKGACLHVTRLKNGSPSTHPLHGPEIKLLRAWQRDQARLPKQNGDYVFSGERGGAMTRINLYHVVAAVGKAAGIKFPVHPHMLRHATGFYLANAGQDTRAIQLYLGHKNIQHTVRYTELSPQRFKDFWRD